jgi:hypothetical protein
MPRGSRQVLTHYQDMNSAHLFCRKSFSKNSSTHEFAGLPKKLRDHALFPSPRTRQLGTPRVRQFWFGLAVTPTRDPADPPLLVGFGQNPRTRGLAGSKSNSATGWVGGKMAWVATLTPPPPHQGILLFGFVLLSCWASGLFYRCKMSLLEQYFFLILTQPSWDGYFLLCSPKSSDYCTEVLYGSSFMKVLYGSPCKVKAPAGSKGL